jgi:prepilin-type N-terminal cleavage/methylation domain-containing protein
MKYRPTALNQKAFTIIELMIATAVLSTILIMVTFMMISIGNLYYKGVNQARVQDDVRTISDDVSQHLQLSDSLPLFAVAGDGTSAYCIGNTRYTYMLNKQVGSGPGQIAHVLWRDSNPAPNSCSASVGFLNSATPSADGVELIAPNSRLTFFSVSLSSPYTISIGVAYGDNNLLNLSGLNTTCKGSIGDQFCSTGTLTTTVVQRITGSGG